MRYARTAAMAVLLAVGATGLQAETLHYYYVSGPAFVSNFEDPAERILLNAGHLKVDRSLLQGSSSLANRTITRYLDEIYDPDADQSHAAIGFEFSQAWPDEFWLVFDENEQIVDWSFTNFVIGGVDWTVNWNSSRWGDALYDIGVYHDPARSVAEWTLSNLGYREGTKAYEDLFCGSWAGIDEANCREWGEAPIAWSAHYMATPGTWQTDPIAWALQIEAVTKLAMANPPISRYDIQPVPLPAPLALLLAGIGGLAMVRRWKGGPAQAPR